MNAKDLNDPGQVVGRPEHYPFELFWVRYQPFLLSLGYKLRDRYNPKWVPSWKIGPNPRPKLTCEDSRIPINKGNVLDAIRMHNNQKIILKRVKTSTDEIPIGLYLTSRNMLSDPRNRSVPILDVILLPDDDSEALIVMPVLLHFERIPFYRAEEVAEMLHQFLQGLQFMHEHNVVHRDPFLGNLMMDASKIIPRGFHYACQYSHDGIDTLRFEWKDRWSVRPTQYYFIDFGLSKRYPTGMKNIKDTGISGWPAPELSLTVPYDPFKVNIYHLGNLIIELIKKYRGLDEFMPLGKVMTRQNPDDRPDATEALRQFKRITSSLKWRQPLRQHPRPYLGGLFDRLTSSQLT